MSTRIQYVTVRYVQHAHPWKHVLVIQKLNIVFLGKPDGGSKAERQKWSWLDCIENYLESIGDKRWRKKAEDRSAWAIVLKKKEIKYDSFSISLTVYTLIKNASISDTLLLALTNCAVLLNFKFNQISVSFPWKRSSKTCQKQKNLRHFLGIPPPDSLIWASHPGSRTLRSCLSFSSADSLNMCMGMGPATGFRSH